MPRPPPHRLALGPRKTLPYLDTSLDLRLGKVRPHWVGAGEHPQTPASPDAAPVATSVHPPRESRVAQASRRSRALLSAPRPAPPRPAPPPHSPRRCAPQSSSPPIPLTGLAIRPASCLPAPGPTRCSLLRALPCVAHRALAPSSHPLPFSSSPFCARSRPTCHRCPADRGGAGLFGLEEQGRGGGRRAQFFPRISQTSCAQAGRFPEILQVTGRFSKDVFHRGEYECAWHCRGPGNGLESIHSALVPGGRGTRVGVEFVRARKLSNKRILQQYFKNSKLMSKCSG